MKGPGFSARTVAFVAIALLARPLGAQPADGTLPLGAVCPRELTAGSPAERTVMIAALATAAGYSSVARPLRGADAVAATTAIDTARSKARCPRARAPGTARVWFNSGRAQVDRDGAVWQGRGVTAAISGGWVARRGMVDVAVRPLVALSENRPFAPDLAMPAGDFRDPYWGSAIDLPYRFGQRPYEVLDPGESYARLSRGPLSVGVSTAAQHWGPSHYYPLVVGTEAGGFPRAFLDLRRASVGVGDVSLEWQIGRLDASRFNALDDGSGSRLTSAAVSSFRPSALPFLEIGAARLFHVRRDSQPSRWSLLMLPFSGILKNRSADAREGGYNQLASVFARVAPASGGMEVYGELYREDHSGNLRDLVGEPDHQSAYVIGVRRAWQRGPGDDSGFSAITLERVNGRATHLARVRMESPVYTHSTVRAGHTYLGQPIGSSAALGGSGLMVAWDRIGPTRSLGVRAEVRSRAQNREGGSWDGVVRSTYGVDVVHHRWMAGHWIGGSLGIQMNSGLPTRANVRATFSLRE